MTGSLEHAAFSLLILTTVKLRRYMRKLVELEFPALQVLSFVDLPNDLDVRVVHEISVSG